MDNTKTLMVVLVLGLIIGLWTYGNANNEAGEITACANKNGLIRLIGDGFRRDECRRNETPVSWNTEGEKGGLARTGSRERKEILGRQEQTARIVRSSTLLTGTGRI